MGVVGVGIWLTGLMIAASIFAAANIIAAAIKEAHGVKGKKDETNKG